MKPREANDDRNARTPAPVALTCQAGVCSTRRKGRSTDVLAQVARDWSARLTRPGFCTARTSAFGGKADMGRMSRNDVIWNVNLQFARSDRAVRSVFRRQRETSPFLALPPPSCRQARGIRASSRPARRLPGANHGFCISRRRRPAAAPHKRPLANRRSCSADEASLTKGLLASILKSGS